MLTKNEIKDIQSLRHKKYRDEAGLFVAEGPKIVNEILKERPAYIQKIYATQEWQSTGGQFESVEISEVELQKISQLNTPNQVLAVIKPFDKTPPSGGFILFLDTIQDPGNLGTIIRIADWFGIQSIVCSQGCADVYNPKVIQASMASIARVNTWYDENNTWLFENKLPVYAASLDGTPIDKVDKPKDGVLMIGNESRGLREEFIANATEKVTIPRLGQAESLNAAVATGIILSHWFI